MLDYPGGHYDAFAAGAALLFMAVLGFLSVRDALTRGRYETNSHTR